MAVIPGDGRGVTGGAAAGQAARSTIVAAAIEGLRAGGVRGTTVDDVARRAGVNPALVLYHFPSLAALFAEALSTMAAERKARYEDRLAGVGTLPELARIGAELHREDSTAGTIGVLTQILAGAAHDPDLAPRAYAEFVPWIEMVERAAGTVLADSPFAELVPAEDLGMAAAALFLGIELLTAVAPDREREESLFRTLGLLALVVDAVMTTGVAPAGDPSEGSPTPAP